MQRVAVQTVRQLVVTHIQCDRCHREFDSDEIFEVQEFVSVRIEGGFSSIFGDGTRLACDLCQYCAKEVLGPFLKEPARDPREEPDGLEEETDEISNETDRG